MQVGLRTPTPHREALQGMPVEAVRRGWGVWPPPKGKGGSLLFHYWVLKKESIILALNDAGIKDSRRCNMHRGVHRCLENRLRAPMPARHHHLSSPVVRENEGYMRRKIRKWLCARWMANEPINAVMHTLFSIRVRCLTER